MTIKTREQKAEEVLHGNGLTDMERIKLMIWGNSKLGVRGLKGRLERVERMAYVTLFFEFLLIVLIIAGSTRVEPEHGSTILRYLVGLLFGL